MEEEPGRDGELIRPLKTTTCGKLAASDPGRGDTPLGLTGGGREGGAKKRKEKKDTGTLKSLTNQPQPCIKQTNEHQTNQMRGRNTVRKPTGMLFS